MTYSWTLCIAYIDKTIKRVRPTFIKTNTARGTVSMTLSVFTTH